MTFFKKSLLFILYFILFTVLINAIFLGIIVFTDWDFVKRRETLRFEEVNYDLLVFGSSLAEYGIDTELLTIYGYNSFNFSLVGSSVKTNCVQLEEYLSKNSYKPKYVMLVVNSYLERFDQEGIQPVVEFTMEGHKYSLKDIPISKFRWAGMEILKKVLKLHYKNQYISYGQKRSFSIEPDISNHKDQYLNLNKFQSSKWIGKMAEICENNNIKFIIIEIPGIKETQNKSEIGPYILNYEFKNNAILYNFNNQEFCRYINSEKEWSGKSHFNSLGAKRFTYELIKKIFI